MGYIESSEKMHGGYSNRRQTNEFMGYREDAQRTVHTTLIDALTEAYESHRFGNQTKKTVRYGNTHAFGILRAPVDMRMCRSLSNPKLHHLQGAFCTAAVAGRLFVEAANVGRTIRNLNGTVVMASATNSTRR